MPTKEPNGQRGWWLPLRQNFVAWRAMTNQYPLLKFVSTIGLVSIDVKNSEDEDDQTLEVVFKGSQMFRQDFEGFDVNNSELYVSTPNENIIDTRPDYDEPPEGELRQLFNSLPSSETKCLPWAPREQLCPSSTLDTTFSEFKKACTSPKQSKEQFVQCRDAFAELYPCFSYYLRSSEQCSIGIDSILDVSVVMHIMQEFTWDYIKRETKINEPWDDEFEIALEMLGLFEHDI